MRKGIGDGRKASRRFTRKILDQLIRTGYRYVQVRGLTADNHYDYIEPSKLVLIPMKELPEDPMAKDIYECTDSQLLADWATGRDHRLEIFI